HPALLANLETTPQIRRTIKGWLQAGILTNGVFLPTTSGTPQGGVASPLLANIALHGLEQAAAAAYRSKEGTPLLTRYADDFVVLHPQLEGIEASRVAIEQWLEGMGLHLSPSKTRVTHTLHLHEGHVGFDF